MKLHPVSSHSLNKALGYMRKGGRLAIPTYAKCTVIDGKALAAWEKAGLWLLKEDGDGYRIRRGKHSDYLLPGQLKYIEE